MRLVNLDVEIDRICNELCGCDREHCKWKVYGEYEGCNQIQELEKAKVVDATPVEWLREKIKEHTDEEVWQDYLANSFGLCIEEWQKEQEAQDG